MVLAICENVVDSHSISTGLAEYNYNGLRFVTIHGYYTPGNARAGTDNSDVQTTSQMEDIWWIVPSV